MYLGLLSIYKYIGLLSLIKEGGPFFRQILKGLAHDPSGIEHPVGTLLESTLGSPRCSNIEGAGGDFVFEERGFQEACQIYPSNFEQNT